MKFIKATTSLGVVVYINADAELIHSISRVPNEDTNIWTGGDERWTVKETPEQILAQLQETQPESRGPSEAWVAWYDRCEEDRLGADQAWEGMPK